MSRNFPKKVNNHVMIDLLKKTIFNNVKDKKKQLKLNFYNFSRYTFKLTNFAFSEIAVWTDKHGNTKIHTKNIDKVVTHEFCIASFLLYFSYYHSFSSACVWFLQYILIVTAINFSCKIEINR